MNPLYLLFYLAFIFLYACKPGGSPSATPPKGSQPSSDTDGHEIGSAKEDSQRYKSMTLSYSCLVVDDLSKSNYVSCLTKYYDLSKASSKTIQEDKKNCEIGIARRKKLLTGQTCPKSLNGYKIPPKGCRDGTSSGDSANEVWTYYNDAYGSAGRCIFGEWFENSESLSGSAFGPSITIK